LAEYPEGLLSGEMEIKIFQPQGWGHETMTKTLSRLLKKELMTRTGTKGSYKYFPVLSKQGLHELVIKECQLKARIVSGDWDNKEAN
jgi:predicted transcriptional regulator